MTDSKDEYRLLFAKADDLLFRAERGEVAVSAFLTPAEAHYLVKHLEKSRAADRVVFFGGYTGATRTRAFFIPDYILALISGEEKEEREKLLLPYIADDTAAAVSSVRIKGSGYRELTHRDYLGSILALGIERHVVGDIAVLSEHEAVVFADPKISDFLISELSKVASDDVKCSPAGLDADFTLPENVEDVVISAASNRIDCIVADLARCSREGAKDLVKSGAVFADYEEVCDPDRKIAAGTVISIRGAGKFRILDEGTKTRRGRLKIAAQRFR